MIAVGSIVLRFDLLIFSTRPATTGRRSAAVTQWPASSRTTSPGSSHAPASSLKVRCVIIPWVNRPANGSAEIEIAAGRHRPGVEAGVEQMQHRMLDATDILVDRQPVVGRLATEGQRRSRLASQKRAKYQELSMKVSNVSVSRRAGSPQRGQATCFQVG